MREASQLMDNARDSVGARDVLVRTSFVADCRRCRRRTMVVREATLWISVNHCHPKVLAPPMKYVDQTCDAIVADNHSRDEHAFAISERVCLCSDMFQKSHQVRTALER